MRVWQPDNERTRAIEALGKELGKNVRCRWAIEYPEDDDDFEPHPVYQARVKAVRGIRWIAEFVGSEELEWADARDVYAAEIESLPTDTPPTPALEVDPGEG